MKTRISTNTGKASKADPLLQNAIAKAWAEIDEMEVVLTRNFNAMIAHAEAGEPIPMEERTLFRYQSGSVVRRCAALVDTLLPLLGGRAVYLSSPVIQPWLDLHAARAHVANDPNNFGPDVVNALLGEPPSFMFL